ncbi:hypothetical protein [Rhizobium sp. F40D2]|uniref:hypothetical protein n=1 Tax=Rhizobium sp. F40D2 TaxID=3453141 RepID=UPI003F25BFB4
MSVTVCAGALPNLMFVKRPVLMEIADHVGLLVSIRGLHRCRELSIIPVLSGRLARPFFSADGQPSGNQRIQQE